MLTLPVYEPIATFPVRAENGIVPELFNAALYPSPLEG
jgi:hypothetical protein